MSRMTASMLLCALNTFACNLPRPNIAGGRPTGNITGLRDAAAGKQSSEHTHLSLTRTLHRSCAVMTWLDPLTTPNARQQ